MHEYTIEHAEVKAAVLALDQTISAKAGKADYFDLRNKLDKKMTFQDGEELD